MRSMRTAASSNGARASWWTLRAATPCWASSSTSSGATPSTTVPRCTPTSPGATRHPGRDEGNITIFWFDHGWFWLIPLADGATSIGAVVWPYYLKSRTKPVKDFFFDTIAMCPALAERLAHATLSSEVEATGNFSYACDRTHGPNYLLIGDAFTFIDPVFSSGVMLAMQGGFVGARNGEHLPARSGPGRLARWRISTGRCGMGPKEFSWFIYRVTHPTMRDMFMGPRNVLRVKEALLSMLAGDIFGKTPIWRSLRVLKAIFYIGSALNFRRSLRPCACARPISARSRAAHLERPVPARTSWKARRRACRGEHAEAERQARARCTKRSGCTWATCCWA